MFQKSVRAVRSAAGRVNVASIVLFVGLMECASAYASTTSSLGGTDTLTTGWQNIIGYLEGPIAGIFGTLGLIAAAYGYLASDQNGSAMKHGMRIGGALTAIISAGALIAKFTSGFVF